MGGGVFALSGARMVVTRAGVAAEKLAPYGQRITILIRTRDNRIRRHRSWCRVPLSYPRTFAMVRRESLDVHWAGASKLKFAPKPTSGGADLMLVSARPAKAQDRLKY